MKRYATKKDMDAVKEAMLNLSEKILQLSEYVTYNIIRQNPYAYDENTRKRIIEVSEKNPILLFAYKDLFLKNPLFSANTNPRTGRS